MHEYYLSRGLGLTPIVPGKKRPLLADWVNRPIVSEVDLMPYLGHNLGWVIGADHLVVDIDPRNGGFESLKHLSQEFFDLTGQKLSEAYPVIKTPGGGCHIYMTKPSKIKTVKDLKDEYPGVDFLSHGSQCLIAGCYDGKYHFFENSPWQEGPQPTPGWLLNKLKRNESIIKTTTKAELTDSQIKSMLGQLPIEDFQNYSDWLTVLQSVHEASAGEGLELFLDWSLSDPKYSHDRDSIVSQWKGTKTGKAGNVTAASLISFVQKYDGVVPRPTFEEEIDDLPELDESLPKTVGAITRDGRDTQPVSVEYLEQLIKDIPPGGRIEKLDSVLQLLIRTQRADRNRLLKILVRKTQYLIGDIRDRLVVLKGKSENTIDVNSDAAFEITDIVLSEGFASNDRITHATDQRFWAYRGTHWSVMERNIIRNKLLTAAATWKTKNGDKKSLLSSLISQSERILEARLASEVDFYKHRQAGDTIINCLNGELNVKADSGNFELKVHNPANWLTHCLPITYTSVAECPEFEKFLLDVFEPMPDTHEIIRHVWELIGYTIQSCKDIATWVLLTGEGSNGKTTLLNVLYALMGDAAMSGSISDITANQHGLASLPGKLILIDEDLNTKYKLPDGFLKKVSENKVLEANPKFEKSFNFENTAIVWMASNSIPTSPDMSYGMIRRAQVLHFGRIFAPREQDRALAKRIIKNELSGILLKALQGLQRLRKRGYFDLPNSANLQTQKWSNQASPIALWTHASLSEAIDEKVLLRDAYVHFRLWCSEQGMDRPATKPSFRKALESAGYKIKRAGGNKLIITGVELIPLENDGMEI